ncbi:cylicin-1 isoform X2 [Manduca sexta]|uniref:cylicin-1 isoform X2 n=1 Tax=Manduca sexta TaxID=7130 RepID=UPI00189012DD|nr:cylicin-1 isoform X2 [Manduca sexta]
MSQKLSTRKSAVNDEKDKRQTDSPVKETKKKMAVAVEKEKQAAEKAEKAEKSEKQTEKNAEKKDKSGDKNEAQAEKPPEDSSKGEKSGKTDKHDNKHKSKVHNGACDALATNGADLRNGAPSPDDDDDALLVIDDEPRDELFPELAYDTSDTECEPDAPSRSLTRRDQNKESKVLKLKEDAQTSDRKLRSSDSPKRDSKKAQEKKQDSKEPEKEEKAEEQPKEQEKVESSKEQEKESPAPVAEVRPETKESDKEEKKQAAAEKFEMEVVIEVEADEEPRKTDTNYSKSRVKVSPYRRSLRLADQTTSSVMANYTGNNTTMEMDITETSVEAEDSALDRSFLRGLRNIRGRNSYKQLDELNLKHLANRANRSSLNTSGREVVREVRETRETRETLEAVSRPTAPVVGRKRGAAADAPGPEPGAAAPAPKRGRLLHRLAHTFRRADIAPEIVGINTDLPLTAPVASAESFDPERLKAAPAPSAGGLGGVGGASAAGGVGGSAPLATPLAPHETRDNKRCLIM